MIGLAALSVAVQLVAPSAAVWGALVLFLLGVPHGAVERRAARRLVPSVGYTAAYLACAALFFAIWCVAPVVALLVFLSVSALHFSASEPVLGSVGLWVVLGSMVTYALPTLDIFAAMTERALLEPPLPAVARTLGVIAGAWLALEALRRGDALYGSLMLALFVLVPPVSAVAIYYFAVHSVREWREVHRHTRAREIRPGRAMLRLYAPFSVPVLLGGVGVIALAASGWLPLGVAAGLGMAVATPHMAPLERWTGRPRAGSAPHS